MGILGLAELGGNPGPNRLKVGGANVERITLRFYDELAAQSWVSCSAPPATRGCAAKAAVS